MVFECRGRGKAIRVVKGMHGVVDMDDAFCLIVRAAATMVQ
jgi:hypothetical protein